MPSLTSILKSPPSDQTHLFLYESFALFIRNIAYTCLVDGWRFFVSRSRDCIKSTAACCKWSLKSAIFSTPHESLNQLARMCLVHQSYTITPSSASRRSYKKPSFCLGSRISCILLLRRAYLLSSLNDRIDRLPESLGIVYWCKLVVYLPILFHLRKSILQHELASGAGTNVAGTIPQLSRVRDRARKSPIIFGPRRSHFSP